MRFWLSRDTATPIREQLCAQIVLGILSRRFRPGERLPSVRELARRLKIHSNTVSSAYRELAARGWVIGREGAGVFVSDRAASYPIDTAEAFAAQCVQDGLSRGYSATELQVAFANVIPCPTSSDFAVADPDTALAEIIAMEIEEAVGVPVTFCDLDGVRSIPAGKRVLANEAHLAALRIVHPHASVTAIQLRSMEDVLEGHQRPAGPVLIAVASRSESILEWSSKLLSALGFPPDCFIQRKTTVEGWQEGLSACDIVAVDIVTARALPPRFPVAVFRIVAEPFLSALKHDVTAQKL